MSRTVFETHLSEPSRMARCPICQQQLEKDHATALLMEQNRTRVEDRDLCSDL